MKRILGILFLGFITTSCYAGTNTTINKGGLPIFGAVLVSSYSCSADIRQMQYSTMSYTTPIISSVTYTSLLDWSITLDKNGNDVWFSNTVSNIDSESLSTTAGCLKKYAGDSFSPDGRLYTAIYGRTKAGTTNMTTVYYILNQDK